MKTNKDWLLIAKKEVEKCGVTIFTEGQIAVVAECLKSYSANYSLPVSDNTQELKERVELLSKQRQEFVDIIANRSNPLQQSDKKEEK